MKFEAREIVRMGAAARELEREVMAVLHGAGAKVLGKGKDGAGHPTVTFEVHRQELLFHYPCTPVLNGHGLKNVTARLRRIIREVPQPPPVLVSELKPLLAAVVSIPERAPPPTPPNPTRLTIQRRREIAKRYLSLGSLDALKGETGLPFNKLTPLILGSGGEAARRLRIEQNVNKAKRAKKSRERAAAMIKTIAAPAAPAIKLPKPIPAMRGPGADNTKRNMQIARLFWKKKIDPQMIADHFGLRVSSVITISHHTFPLL
jgi:hypothetical protein